MADYPVNPNVYNGGAVSINTTPFANFYLQQQAKQQAKVEALDNYYRDQLKAVTPTGVRAKDIEGGFSQKLNNWQQLGVKNRKYLLNPKLDNYQTINEFNRQKNELLGDIETSKRTADEEKRIADLKMSGHWIPTDDDMKVVEDVGRSIYDKNRKGLSFNDLSPNLPQFDSTKFLTAAQSGMKMGTVEEAPIINAKQGLQTINFSQRYTPQEIRTIADRAGLIAQSDGVAKSNFEKVLHSPEYPQLQEIYSSVYGNDIMDTPAKVAKAFAIMNVGQPTGFGSRTEKYVDPNAQEAREKRMAIFKHKLNQDEIRLRDELENKGADEQGGAVSKWLDGLKDEAIATGKVYNINTPQGTTKTYQIPITPGLAKTFERTNKYGKKVQPTFIGVSEDGKFYPLFPELETKTENGETVYTGKFKTKNGKIVIDENLSVGVGKDALKPEVAKTYLTPTMVEENLGDDNAVPRPPKPEKTAKSTGDWRSRATKVNN